VYDFESVAEGWTVKRYLYFAGLGYYPDGGWRDFRGSFDTADQASAAALRDRPEDVGADGWWWHIIDQHTGEPVMRMAHESGETPKIDESLPLDGRVRRKVEPR
jgi:hypothetical protein